MKYVVLHNGNDDDPKTCLVSIDTYQEDLDGLGDGGYFIGNPSTAKKIGEVEITPSDNDTFLAIDPCYVSQ